MVLNILTSRILAFFNDKTHFFPNFLTFIFIIQIFKDPGQENLLKGLIIRYRRILFGHEMVFKI